MATGWWNDQYEPSARAEPDEDTIPDPIYIKSTDLEELRMRYQRLAEQAQEDINVSSDEEDNEEGNLDLTAPPLDSWFHGRISRSVACERLEMVGEDGCYLVRESTHEQNEYILSYLSNSSVVYHFKIHSNCGDYYIGGRQFLQLSDLIGFYANCSCILENESLRVPVVPPKPVPLYLMLRASSSHIKSNNDELNVAPGEVYMLLSKLSDDWGWARSQRTGESGLIPIVIMEDVTHKDPNLGKPWFFSSVSRDEAVELVKQSEIGSYLIRLSEAAGVDEVNYSMAVKTIDSQVQRFRIIRYINGYYMFGGRPYSSMEDIIERYTKREVILDGLKLGSPVAMAQLSPQQVHPSRAPPVPRERSDSTCIPVDSINPGDKKQNMNLWKGKKLPLIGGKWRQMFVMFRYSDQKLLFYENERSHRSKGLLDLKECKVYLVHPSLTGRLDCFVVWLCYLNEITFYYLSAGSPEIAKEWVSLLRQFTKQGISREVKEIEQSRSFTLGVKECKINAKGHSQVFVLVFINGVCLARTRVIPEPPYIFEENFTFEDLPQTAESFSCEVHSNKTKRLGTIVGKGTSLGRITVHISDLPNGQADDQWHQLLGGAKTAKGSVRLVANFKDLVILPLDEYRSLKELILSDDLVTIELLAHACKEHHAELASTLVQIFCHYNRVVPLLIRCLSKAIDKEQNVGTLFRASTLSTMLMDQFMKLTASSYLKSLLKEPISQMIESQHSCEINPSYLNKGEDVSQNLARLEGHLQNVVSTIFKSVEDCPPALRFIFRALQAEVVAKWPTDESVRTRAVSGFLFLRFVCPALLKPQLFDLVSENPSPQADRALKLVTKGVQNLANLVEFKKKEDFTVSLNPFILRNMAPMRHFVHNLASISHDPPPVELEDSDPRRDLATIFNLCSTYERALSNLVKKEPEAKKLLGVMQSLRTTEKKFANKAAAS